MDSSENKLFRKIGSELTWRTDHEIHDDKDMLRECQKLLPAFGMKWNYYSSVFQKASTLARHLHYNELYPHILDVPGVVCEFGVQWGVTLNLLANLRTIYEPHNINRTLIGFDTFSGFFGKSEEDGKHCKDGDYSVPPDYQKTLEQILLAGERAAPYPRVRKHQLVRGDASATVRAWLTENPESIISMAIFDMDLYRPTKQVLKSILPRLTRGSLLVFDQLSCPAFPGETLAVLEVLGLNQLRLRKTRFQPYSAWAIFGE